MEEQEEEAPNSQIQGPGRSFEAVTLPVSIGQAMPSGKGRTPLNPNLSGSAEAQPLLG